MLKLSQTEQNGLPRTVVETIQVFKRRVGEFDLGHLRLARRKFDAVFGGDVIEGVANPVVFAHTFFGDGLKFTPLVFFFKKSQPLEHRDVDNRGYGLVVVQNDLHFTGLGFGDSG